jgi:hypothetical protein
VFVCNSDGGGGGREQAKKNPERLAGIVRSCLPVSGRVPSVPARRTTKNYVLDDRPLCQCKSSAWLSLGVVVVVVVVVVSAAAIGLRQRRHRQSGRAQTGCCALKRSSSRLRSPVAARASSFTAGRGANESARRQAAAARQPPTERECLHSPPARLAGVGHLHLFELLEVGLRAPASRLPSGDDARRAGSS